MRKELEEAVNAIDDKQDNFSESDIVYKGNLDKWKKLGHSMMLRLGMRMTKVDPGASESWVKKAINGGVLESNRDNLIINATDASGAGVYLTNEIGFILRVRSSTAVKMTQTFIRFFNSHTQ